MGKCEKWTIAYRVRRGENTLIDDTTAPFTKIPNSWRYWAADPFLVETEGKTWLFAELYDRLQRKGVLGCRDLNDPKWTIILDEPFHLSYPFVFKQNGTFYMIPESFRAGKIRLYKAVSFPYSWEPVCDLAEMAAVDSTVIQTSAGQFLLTVRVVNAVGTLTLMKVEENWNLSEPICVAQPEDANVRPAGKAFRKDGTLIRPTQDCSAGYGYALNFARITKMDGNSFEEQRFMKIRPEDVRIDHVRTPEGIHTYNFSEHYEVIDYKEYEFGFVSKVGGLMKRLKGK